MDPETSGRPGQMASGLDDFRQSLHAQLLNTGVLGSVKGQLRAQLLAQLKKGELVVLKPGTDHAPNLKQRALNSMLVEYLSSASYPYSLSVFSEESGTGATPSMSESEILNVLSIEQDSMLYQAYIKTKDTQAETKGRCLLLNLLHALAEVGTAGRSLGTATQTTGGDRFQLQMKMQQLDQEYENKLRTSRLNGPQGVEERMALYRQQLEEQAKADVARQVQRVREVEVAAVRLEEAAKWRRALEGERQELERLHVERLAKLRSREEDLSEKLKRQQREVESLAFDHRQRLLREEERLRAWRQEAQSVLDGREEQLKHLGRALELREKAVVSREVAAESRAAEAAQAVGTAHINARAEVEKEYLELKATLAAQRLQLEMDRARVAEMRSEAAAESAAARAKEDRLRALETARAEAEARAAAHAAEAEIVRLQVERLQLELAHVRDQLRHKVSLAAESADAMLSNAAGALGMLEKEAQATHASSVQLTAMQEQVAAAHQALQEQQAAAQLLVAERDEARARAEEKVSMLKKQLKDMGDLVEQALAARDAATRQAEDAEFASMQLQRELTEVRASLGRCREELLVSHARHASATSARAMPNLPSQHGLNAASLRMDRPLRQMDVYGGPSSDQVGSGALSGLGWKSLRSSWDVPSSSFPYSEHGKAQAQRFAANLGLPTGTGATPQIYTLSPAKLNPRYPASVSAAAQAGAAADLPIFSTGRPFHTQSVDVRDANAMYVPDLPKAVAGMSAAEPTSPVRERLARLSREEAELASEVDSFRKRVSEQRQASARELQLVMTRVALSSPATSPCSTPGTGFGGQPASPILHSRQDPTCSFNNKVQGNITTSLHIPSACNYQTLPPTAGTFLGGQQDVLNTAAVQSVSGTGQQLPIHTHIQEPALVVPLQQAVGTQQNSLPSLVMAERAGTTTASEHIPHISGLYAARFAGVPADKQLHEASNQQPNPVDMQAAGIQAPAAASLSFSDIPTAVVKQPTHDSASLPSISTSQPVSNATPAQPRTLQPAQAPPAHHQQLPAESQPTRTIPNLVLVDEFTSKQPSQQLTCTEVHGDAGHTQADSHSSEQQGGYLQGDSIDRGNVPANHGQDEEDEDDVSSSDSLVEEIQDEEHDDYEHDFTSPVASPGMLVAGHIRHSVPDSPRSSTGSTGSMPHQITSRHDAYPHADTDDEGEDEHDEGSVIQLETASKQGRHEQVNVDVEDSLPSQLHVPGLDSDSGADLGIGGDNSSIGLGGMGSSGSVF